MRLEAGLRSHFTAEEISGTEAWLQHTLRKVAQSCLDHAVECEKNGWDSFVEKYINRAVEKEAEIDTHIINADDVYDYIAYEEDCLARMYDDAEERFAEWQEKAAETAPCKGMGVSSGKCPGYGPDCGCAYYDRVVGACRVMDM